MDLLGLISASRIRRVVAQVLALLVAAVAVAWSTATEAAAVPTALLAVLLVAVFKAVLMLAADATRTRNRQHRLDEQVKASEHGLRKLEGDLAEKAGALLRAQGAVADGATSLAGQVETLRRQFDSIDTRVGPDSIETLRQQLDSIDTRVGPDSEAAAILVRRFEPVLARLAVLQNDVLELRELVARIERRSVSRSGTGEVLPRTHQNRPS